MASNGEAQETAQLCTSVIMQKKKKKNTLESIQVQINN